MDGHVILHVVVRTVSFPDDWPPILPISRCAINQPCVDMQEMNPHLVVALLVGKFDSKNFMIKFERTLHGNMPLSLGTKWLDEPTHIGPFFWNFTCKAEWNWHVRVGKLLLNSAVAPLGHHLVQHVGSLGKKHGEKETQAVAGTNSLNSSRGILGFCSIQRRKPRNQEKNPGARTRKKATKGRRQLSELISPTC